MLLCDRWKKNDEKHEKIEFIIQSILAILFIVAFIMFSLSSFKVGNVLLKEISKENTKQIASLKLQFILKD